MQSSQILNSKLFKGGVSSQLLRATTMLRILVISLLSIILCACSTYNPKGYVKHVDNRTILKENSKLYVKVPDGTALIIGKAAPNSGNVDHMGMIYPAVTPVDFFAAIITHAAITESVKNDKKNKAQDLADEVILPYRPFVKDIANQALVTQLNDIALSRGFELARFQDSQSEDDMVLDITPIYLLNQQQDTLTLRTQFLVYQKKELHIAAKKRAVFYQNQIEVLSSKIESESPQEYWLANNGLRLVTTMRSLLSKTLELGAVQVSSNREHSQINNQQNFRYDDGDTTAFERASIISDDCERVVIHTLRGWLKSIPIERLKDKHVCQKGLEANSEKPIINAY
ncbi:hypothetical protein Q4557_00690 [Shewanella sp. 5_MG-2023]|uniref:hypothetical protein n=1 Tax=Shewanella sp. 5_MG-2023 TaxID=3062656 RepID=UPI0026E2D467|nr:hypothetical protein [Shewanella sp. 5_MG-2023]MDO6638477.1 hypothetical protein [Shewanella sp. 5_MG-2023]